MMRYISLTLSTILLFLFPVTLIAQADDYDGKLVEEVKVVPKSLPSGSSFDSRSVLTRLKTLPGEHFSQEEFDGDLKLLTRDFYRVEPSIEIVNERLVIMLEVTPKPTISSINWIGNNKLKESNLRRELSIKPGATFDRKAFTSSFNDVKSLAVKSGFFEAELEYTVTHNTVNNTVDIDITIDEGRSGRIKTVEFNNFTKEERAIIADKILTKKFNLFTSWLSQEGTYHDEMVQQDQMIILDFLQNQGYADAHVDVEVIEAKQKNRIIIKITAEKGERYTLGEVVISGNTVFTAEDLLSIMQARKGDIFSPDRLRNSSQTVTDHYGSQGYIDTFVAFNPRLDPERAVYHVDFTVEEGKQYRIGMINVFGNACTQSQVILHESLLVPGDVFDIHRLKQTESKLRNIGYFESVNVYAVRSSSNEGPAAIYRDVNIEVEEKGTGSFSAFFGFSTMEAIFGGLNLTERNFNWRGLSDIYNCGLGALRGGGEYAHITTTIGQRNNSYVASWAKPFFYDTCWVVGFEGEVSNNRVTSDEYRISAQGLTLFAKYPLNDYLQFGIHYRFRHSDAKVSDDASERLLAQRDNSGLISATGVSLVYDSTNDIRKPTSGFRSSLNLEYVGLGGNHTFGSIAYVNTYYWQLYCNTVIKFRGDFRYVLPTGDTTIDTLPLDERFFLGGENSLRGYRPFSIGPRFETGEPSGGLSSSLASVEYAYFIHPKADIFAFFDTGSISKQALSVEEIFSSVGFGTRLSVIPGAPPITIGMGYPVGTVDIDKEKKFFMSIGGEF